MRQRKNNVPAIKIIVLFAVIALISENSLKAQEDVKITWNYDGLTFRQFVDEAESRAGIRFFFRDEWVQDLKPGDYPGITSLPELLSKMFKTKFLYFYRDSNGDFIITKNAEVEHI